MVTDNMKTKFNLVGNTFTHLTNGNKGYSVHGKESQYIEWVQDGGEATFYIDDTINDGVTDKRVGPKYLWLLESKFIKPGLVESIIQNRELVENTYEVIFTHDQRLLNLGDKFKWVPAQGFWIKEPKIYEKSKMIYFSARGIENTARVDFYSIGFDGKNLKRLSVGDYNYSAIYLAPDIIPQGKINARFSLDVGIKKLIQKSKGELFFNATDLLNTMVTKKEIKGQGFIYTSNDFYETQVIRVGYSYKF